MLRTILITGSSSGIGNAIKEHLLEKGHTVIGIARRKQEKNHRNFFPYCIDLKKIKELPKALEALAKTFPNINGLICNAGMGKFANLEELSLNDLEDILHTNFLSHAYLSKYFLPSFKSLPHSDIIFIGSQAALVGEKKGTIYCASKFALRGFAQALRAECASSSVRVCIIQPGMVETEFYDQLYFTHGDSPLHSIKPTDIAHTISHILEMRQGTTFEEITLSPHQKVISFKKNKNY